jgi:hypothetical protein
MRLRHVTYHDGPGLLCASSAAAICFEDSIRDHQKATSISDNNGQFTIECRRIVWPSAAKEVAMSSPSTRRLPTLAVHDFGPGQDHVAVAYQNGRIFAILHKNDPAHRYLPSVHLEPKRQEEEQ